MSATKISALSGQALAQSLEEGRPDSGVFVEAERRIRQRQWSDIKLIMYPYLEFAKIIDTDLILDVLEESSNFTIAECIITGLSFRQETGRRYISYVLSAAEGSLLGRAEPVRAAAIFAMPRVIPWGRTVARLLKAAISFDHAFVKQSGLVALQQYAGVERDRVRWSAELGDIEKELSPSILGLLNEN